MNITEEQARSAAFYAHDNSDGTKYVKDRFISSQYIEGYAAAIEDCAKWMDHSPDCEKVVGHYVNVDIGQGGAYYTYDTCTCGLDEFLRTE